MKVRIIPKRLFENKSFCFFLISCFFLYLLSQFYYIAQVTMVVEVTSSTIILGTVLMVMAIPRLLILPIGGFLTDKFNEKILFVVGYSSLVIILVTQGILISLNLLSLNLIFIFAGLFGISSAAILPATYSIVPKLVDETILQSANALVQLLNQFSFFIGPAIAGLFLGIINLATFIFIMAGLIGVSLITVLRLNIDEGVNDDKPDNDTEEDNGLKGFLFVLKNRKVLLLIIFTCMLNLSVIGPQQVGLPVLADRVLNIGSDGLGYLLSALGFGSIIGVLIAGTIPVKHNTIMFMSLATMAFGLMWVGFSWIDNIYIVFVLLCLIGLLISVINIIFITTLQKSSSKSSHGKLMSLVFMGSTGLQPISHFMTGVLISITNLQIMYVIAGSIVIGLSTVIIIVDRKTSFQKHQTI